MAATEKMMERKKQLLLIVVIICSASMGLGNDDKMHLFA